MTSRAYRGVASDSSDAFSISILSSAGRTASWYMLSGLSLSEISRIAILAIPIYPGDLSNQQAYDFEPSFDDFADAATIVLPRAHDQKKMGSAKRFLAKLIPGTRPKSPSPPTQKPARTIFGGQLRMNITYANVAINLQDEDGRPYVYGYIPMVVAKPAIFIKEKGMLVVAPPPRPPDPSSGTLTSGQGWKPLIYLRRTETQNAYWNSKSFSTMGPGMARVLCGRDSQSITLLP